MDTRTITDQLHDLTSGSAVALFYSDHCFKLWDWKMNGTFTKLAQAGTLSPKYGEVTLNPILWNEKQLSFYIIGMGDLETPDAHLKSLAKKLTQKTEGRSHV